MKLRNAIGIDPDSKGFVCALVRIGENKAFTKGFLSTESNLKQFIGWVKKQEDTIISIEGHNGQSKPIEKALSDSGIVFYSFKPSDVAQFRKSVLGQNKNNRRDAESVGRYAMALEAQGKLENHKRLWFPDQELQNLTRSHEQKTKELTREINRLWKLIRMASVDLYLALGGNNPAIGINENILKSKGIINLLLNKPNIFLWKELSELVFLELMGGHNYKGRVKLIKEIKKVSKTFKPISSVLVLMIKNSAEQISILKHQKKEIEDMFEVKLENNQEVKALKEIRGISTVTASKIIAEIVNIRRFVKDDSLACYSGLCLIENKTGASERMKHSSLFNHRLKDAFMVAAMNFVKFNPDSHLSGYFRNLIKGGMKRIEARKRTARALVRVIFKKLYELPVELPIEKSLYEIKNENQSDMASSLNCEDINNPSNISTSVLKIIKSNKAKIIKNKKPKGGIKLKTKV